MRKLPKMEGLTQLTKSVKAESPKRILLVASLEEKSRIPAGVKLLLKKPLEYTQLVLLNT